MHGDLRDYKIFVMAVSYIQDIRRFVAQDEMKTTGEERVIVELRVLATHEEYATVWVHEEYSIGFKDLQIESIEIETLDAAIMTSST